VARLRNWRHSASRISTDDPTLRAAVDRAVDDLGALRIFDPAHTDRTVVAAGAPWFMTLFGRDSLLTSWMSLLVDHDLALGVLQELADTQGEREDPRSDEQPGKILHEVRFDRLSARLLGGHGRYYGSIDATPLFVMLAAELTRWVGADDRIRSLLPAVDRAIEWIDRFGDRDGDGFIEYLRGDPAGLEHQGWKDSWDGIRHADGAVAAPPIALCEAQGYVYGALLARADLARSFGESAETRRTFLERADHFKAHFNDAFWSDRRGAYIVGLDAEKRPIESNASNIGHLLWTGIVPEARRRAVADLLVAPSMFSGWGLRTLASDAAGYNPLSYHCGSVWPHDTAIAVAGLAAACLDDAASVLAGGLLDASTHSGGRLPELFAGFARDDVGAPVPYPASCSPQAWSAAAPLLLVRAMLGLQPDAVAGRLLLRPRLAPGIDRLHVTGLPIGDATVDIRVEGADATVDVVGGSLDVNVR
ncbi:MAG: amylo-alpha-1,6-glucosidase, partial [Actinomycetota bacterium]